MSGESQKVIIQAYLEESPNMSDTFSLSIRVGPEARFEANPVIGTVPHTVTFKDTSVGEITSWDWNFGDGFSSTLPNPIHTYSDSGVYSVSLAVTSSNGTDLYIRTNLISITSNTLYLPFVKK